MVGQSQSYHLWRIAVVAHPLQYGRSQSAGTYAVLYHHNLAEALGHLLENGLVKGLQEAHVVVGDAFEVADGCGDIVADGAYGEHGDTVAVAELTSGADGDFLKLFDDIGYVVRQGELIRDDTDNSAGFVYDMLLIDSEGDFHVVNSATTESIDAYVAEYLTPLGRTIYNTFNCGPVLVQNGRVPLIAQSEAAIHESYEWRYPCQRQCILQTGPLEYAIVEVAGEGGETTGFTMTEFAEYVAEKFPDAILAYNLAGGHATSLIAWKNAGTARGERICFTPTPKLINDILYFASAED